MLQYSYFSKNSQWFILICKTLWGCADSSLFSTYSLKERLFKAPSQALYQGVQKWRKDSGLAGLPGGQGIWNNTKRATVEAQVQSFSKRECGVSRWWKENWPQHETVAIITGDQVQWGTQTLEPDQVVLNPDFVTFQFLAGKLLNLSWYQFPLL